MQKNNSNSAQNILGFSLEEYFLNFNRQINKEQNNFLAEYEIVLKEMSQASQEEINEVSKI